MSYTFPDTGLDLLNPLADSCVLWLLEYLLDENEEDRLICEDHCFGYEAVHWPTVIQILFPEAKL